MSNRSLVTASAVPTNVSTETIVATSTPMNANNPGGQGNSISGVVNITAGTGTTAVVVRVRAGTTTAGTNLGPAAGVSHTLAAGASANIGYEFNDPSNQLSNQQYVVSVTQTGGTGAGTVNYVTIGVLPCNAAS